MNARKFDRRALCSKYESVISVNGIHLEHPNSDMAEAFDTFPDRKVSEIKLVRVFSVLTITWSGYL